MPVHPCQKNGKPGWKWGGKGKCYTYTKGDSESSKRAHAKAEAQGRAARASGWQGKDYDEEEEEDMEEECPECLKALPDVHPNEDEQTYVSRCIAFEKKHSPGRPDEQIQRMCYEKYRSATGKKSEDIMTQIESDFAQIKAEFEELKKSQPKN